MALPGTYTNLRDIIERVYRKYGFNEINEDEAAEWTWDIMGKIGLPTTFQDENTIITIVDYKGELPKNFFTLNDGGIREAVSKTPLRALTDIYYQTEDTGDITPQILPQDLDATTGEYLHAVIPSENNPEYYTFKIDATGLTVGFLTGEVEMAYKSFPICPEFGLPLIPDDAKYIEAVVDYISLSIALRLFMTDKISEKKYNLIERNSTYSAGAARSRGLMPDTATMETLRNIWMSPFPYYQHSDYGFRYLGSRIP